MRILVRDVAPRDGLQNVEAQPPAIRAELVNRLAEAGLPRIECAAFVSEAAVPQMSGAEDVVSHITRRPNVTYDGLVVNERGYDRLAGTGLDAVSFVFVTTETFNRRNQGVAVAESIRVAQRVIDRAHRDGIRVGIVIGAAFGCPFEGRVDPGRVLEQATALASMGAGEISLADTIGVAVPGQVRRLVGAIAGLGPTVGVHLHNTRNTGYANAYAAIESGVQMIDASVGGLGGCPFAPDATGNIATEDLVYLLENDGVATGIDLDGLIAVSRWLSEQIDSDLPGQLHRVGPFPAPAHA